MIPVSMVQTMIRSQVEGFQTAFPPTNAALRPGQLPRSFVLCSRRLGEYSISRGSWYHSLAVSMLPPMVDKQPSIITMMTHDDWMPQVGPRKYFLEPLRPKITSHHRTMDVAGGQEESALVTVELDPGDTGDNDNQGEKQKKKKKSPPRR
ncbi:hypothetical protein BDQ94DRAFT_76409 [Aspergillus welwitschiae]|uniref:Uncharacterized protein n=1 Tax=Aspergillus welwitschiae TaxID=1341132 RepID=A0A3F3PU27_9EURO|nr:hypothetical protein BDQ94DRAFT_76409 [Aspergillus welwitschiae]RDH30437.1 hypothetical protein BDQ94DRAFT_76409 [Aspergillus welwitschiae]